MTDWAATGHHADSRLTPLFADGATEYREEAAMPRAPARGGGAGTEGARARAILRYDVRQDSCARWEAITRHMDRLYREGEAPDLRNAAKRVEERLNHLRVSRSTADARRHIYEEDAARLAREYGGPQPPRRWWPVAARSPGRP